MDISQAFSCLVCFVEMMAIHPILFYFVNKCQYGKKRKKKKKNLRRIRPKKAHLNSNGDGSDFVVVISGSVHAV